MRIIGGQAKGRLLAPLKGLEIRPTSDRVREAVFNLIGQDMIGLKVLDLFAGTGGFGIEALSRGASGALFIDHSPSAVRLIRQNLVRCNLQNLGVIFQWDLSKGIPIEHPNLAEKIDRVFIDPPYGKGLIPVVVRDLWQRNVLAPNAVIVTESSKRETLPTAVGDLRLVRTKLYGDTKIDIYRTDNGDKDL